MKGKCYVFSGHKQRNKVWLVYFYSVNCNKIAMANAFSSQNRKLVERAYLEKSNQKARSCRSFWMLNCLRKENTFVFGLCQGTTKVQCMYLALKNLKIRFKKGHETSKI